MIAAISFIGTAFELSKHEDLAETGWERLEGADEALAIIASDGNGFRSGARLYV